MQFPKFSIVLIAGLLLAGCDSSNQAPAAGAGATAAAPTASSTPASAAPAANPLQPQYAATLAEGIDFARPGYPEFLSEVSGMSGVESWGRWTDANLANSATFHFKQALPAKFTLEITGYAIGPNVGQPIRVQIGNVEKILTFTDMPAQTTAIAFEGVRGADAISLIVPNSIQPSAISDSADTRKLGLALVSLKIRE